MNYRLKFYIMLSAALLGASLIIENYQQMGGFGGANIEAILKTAIGFVMVAAGGPLAYYYFSRSKQPVTKEQLEVETLAKRQEQKDKQDGLRG